MSGVDLKLVLLGQKNVGKTSVFNRYVYDEFGPTSMTIGAYFAVKQCQLNSRRSYNLAIWDTAGEEKFDSLTNFYCRGAQAAVMCYDVTNASSFKSLQRWLSKLKDEADDNCVIIICGNKMDLVEEDANRKEVSFSEAQRFAANHNAEAVEVSARSGTHINDVFTKVVQLAIERNLTPSLLESDADPNNVNVSHLNQSNNYSNRCC